MLAETIDIRFGLLPDFRLFFIKAQHSLCMRKSVSDEMLYLEAGGKEKTDGEEKEEEDGFEFTHKIRIIIAKHYSLN